MTGSDADGGASGPVRLAASSMSRRFAGPGSRRIASTAATAVRQSMYITTTQVAGWRPAYRPWTRAAHHAGYASACRARQRPAILPGVANALRIAPVAAATIISSPASAPKPTRPAVPLTPVPNGTRAPSRPTCPSATFTVPCRRRKHSEATAAARWTPWQTSR